MAGRDVVPLPLRAEVPQDGVAEPAHPVVGVGSAHTVRDYLKAIFDTVGVGSRGELVARLFAEHYADPMHDALVHSD